MRYPDRQRPSPTTLTQNFTKETPMKKKHIYTNIHKAIFRLTGVGISQDLFARRAVASSCQSSNKSLGSPPPLYMY